MKSFFNFDRYGTDYRQEVLAGVTTFLTMAYIIIVNPAILEAAGIPKGPSMTATILSAAFGTFIMGLYARRPFAIAPYMGENAFIAFTVVKVMGYSWQQALGAIFIAGILFTILTLLKVRGWLADAIPHSLKYSFAVGIGFFLTFIGLNEAGIVKIGVPGAPVSLGNLTQPPVILAFVGLLVIIFLIIKRIHGAIILGIITTTALSLIFGLVKVPDALIGLPASPAPIIGQFDVAGVLTPEAFPIILIIFVMAFVDTVGTLIGLSARAGLLDSNGNLPEIEKPMLADAVANLLAPFLGTTTTGAYIESAAGIEEGGRTGLTAVVVAVLFLLTLFLSPILTIVPPHAYGIALVVIGIFMMSPITKICFDDYTELVPSFLTITLMSFTYNVGVGITAGIIAYPILKVATGRLREVPAGMWILALLSVSFYIFYPYK